jgi:hypothetical protein
MILPFSKCGSNSKFCRYRQVCSHDQETGETHCAGGTGKCSCAAPFFGADCSLRPCNKRYLVREGIDVTAGEYAIRLPYAARGWAVKAGRCRLTVSKPESKAGLVSALDTMI